MVDHIEHGLQNADDRAVRAVFAFGKPAQTVEVTEEFVNAVDEVNDHFAGTKGQSVILTGKLEPGFRQRQERQSQTDPVG